ncbi:MAG: outer membrane beta-barrel protein [Rhodoferax sp.]|nr:outer membrane beta-barrel protein [Rhodoferax sp.]MCF8210083.1 outer membrane beta-barrel protein [Rhodoferax sp.]
MEQFNMKNAVKYLLIPAIVVCASAAQAQTAGSWLVRAGATTITPNVTSGDLSPPSLPSTQASIGSSSRVSGGITYMLTNNVVLDLPLAVPFEHEISGASAINGAGKIGSVKALPATVFAQWRFMEANSAFRPYVGFGITYAAFFGARSTSTLTAISGGTPSNPTTISVESKWAASAQLGASVALNKNWFVDANYTYTPLSTRTTLSTNQTMDSKINPSSFSLAVGYKF